MEEVQLKRNIWKCRDFTGADGKQEILVLLKQKRVKFPITACRFPGPAIFSLHFTLLWKQIMDLIPKGNPNLGDNSITEHWMYFYFKLISFLWRKQSYSDNEMKKNKMW